MGVNLKGEFFMKTFVHSFSLAFALVAVGVAFGATTLTWTGGGDGMSWNDPENWGQTVNYPDSAAYSAKFTSDATVIVEDDVTIHSLEIDAGADVVLLGAEGGFPEIWLDNAFTLNGALTLGHLSLYCDADLTPGNEASLSLEDGASLYLENLKLLSGQPLSLSEGAWASVNELHVNDPATIVTIDDSALNTRSHFYCGSTTAPGGGRIVFKGEAPLLDVRGNNFRTSTNTAAWTAGFDWDFEIPLGGYAEPPIQTTSAILFDKMGNTTHQNRFNVLATSPALIAGTRLETALVHAPSGIVRNRAEGTSASAPVSFTAMSGAAATTDATAQHLVMTLNPSAAEVQEPVAVYETILSPAPPMGTASRRTITATYQVTALANDGTTTRATLEGGMLDDPETFTEGTSAILTAPGKYSNISWTAPKGFYQTCYFCVRIDQIDGNGDVVATSYSELFSADTVDSGATYIFLK